jgi:hypothetical protein
MQMPSERRVPMPSDRSIATDLTFHAAAALFSA